MEHDGEMQVGVISAPAMRERWYASRGGGAWNDGPDGRRPIRVSRVAPIDDAQLVYGSHRDNVASGLMPGFDALIDASWRDRGFGDFWGYALVAEGAAEAMMETGMHTWDLAAPQVVIEEAGGRVTDVERRAPDRRRVVRGLQRAAPRGDPPPAARRGIGDPDQVARRNVASVQQTAPMATAPRIPNHSWSLAIPSAMVAVIPTTAIDAEEELPQAANAGEQGGAGCRGLLRIRPVGLRRLPGLPRGMRGRRRLRDLLADRRQAEQRATRLRQRPGIGRVRGGPPQRRPRPRHR